MDIRAKICYVMLMKRTEHRAEKQREYQRNYYQRNKEKELARQRKWREENPGWMKEWEEKNKEKRKQIKERWLSKPENVEKSKKAAERWRHSEAGIQRLKEWHEDHFSEPKKRWRRALIAAKHRAAGRGLTFDDELFEHIKQINPTHCSCCGVQIDYQASGKNKHRSVSFDRVDNTKGYTVQNVAVVCLRCNHLKNDATVDELKTIIAYIEREMAKRYP